MTLPNQIIEQDHALEGAAGQAQEKLAQLRWHWTLDESNPKRVPIREYARSVGRDASNILRMVNGYAQWAVANVRNTSLSDSIATASMSDRRRTAAELVAKGRGTNVANVVGHHSSAVNDLLATAEKAAERRGTSVEDELPRVAKGIERARKSIKKEQVEQRKGAELFARIELRITTAERALREILEYTRDDDNALDDEMTALVAGSIDNLRKLLGLIDLTITGRTDIDWDAEFADIGGAS